MCASLAVTWSLLTGRVTQFGCVSLSGGSTALHSSLWRRRTLKYPDRRGERGAGDGADGFAGTDGGCGELIGRADIGIRNDLAFDQPIAEESYHFGTGRELTMTQCIAVSQRGQIENSDAAYRRD